ncbi:non-ribosomal peptide synthetase [Rhizobium rhizosphaerae]|nr:non-ribosomal peptide synthetase [Xaviernesmea rhizosphaerae]
MTIADPMAGLRARVASLPKTERETLRRQLEARGIAWERVAPPEDDTRESLKRLPLTPGQRHFWVQQRLYPESSAYHVAYRWRLKGPLDVEALARSLDHVVARHAALRTAFPLKEGEPWQQVQDAAPLVLARDDVSGSEAALEAAAAAVAVRPFDFTSAPLMRAHLLRLDDHDHVLAITFHHIIADGWSRGVFLRDLTRCYRALQAGIPPDLPPLTLDYGDHVRAQQHWLESPACARARRFWQDRLSGLKVMDLPSDRSRSLSMDMTGATVTRTLPLARSGQVEALAARLGTTAFGILAAGFLLLLHRYSGQRDLAVCVPVAGRGPSEADLIGLFTNTVVLRAEIDPRLTFAAWVERVQERFSDALDHQDFPFPLLAEALGMERDARQSPLTQIMFQHQSGFYREQNAQVVDFGVAGLSVQQEPAPLREAKVDLSWTVMEREAGLFLNIEYRTALFDAWRIERMALHFETLLGSILQAPETLLPALAYLPADERDALIAEGTPAHRPLPEITVDQAIAEVAARHPEAEALVAVDGVWTYGALMQAVDRLAQRLVQLPDPVRPGDRVAVSLPGRGQSVIAFLAILKAGAVYVPLDPDHPAERVAAVLADSGVTMVLTDQPHIYPGRAHLDPACLRPDAGHAVLPSSNPAGIAYLLYTSGSTGRPNGVPIEHLSLYNHLRAMADCLALMPGHRMLAITTPTFDISILEMLLPLFVGATTVLHGQDLLLAPQRLAGLLAEQRISHMQATPAYWRMLIDSGWEGSPDLTALCGGEALDAPLAGRLLARTGTLWNVYGPTEATIWASARRVTLKDAESGRVPVGGLIDNTHLHVLDAYLEPLPRGIAGDLYIGGACLSPGYWNRPALTASRFLPNPFCDPDHRAPRLYRTGDAALRGEGGAIEFLGRTDFQVKLRGYRIEIGEIEDKLLRESMVEQAIVTLDEAHERLVAYVLVKDAQDCERRLRQALTAQLPRYMVPTAIVLMDAFPLNANGKIDRKRLPVPQVSGISEAAVPARTAGEAKLLAIWKAALRRDDFGVEDNFFDLGGDSIIGVQIVARAEQAGLRLAPTQIFELQTVAAQAAAATRIDSLHNAGDGRSAEPATEAPPAAPRLRSPEEEADTLAQDALPPADTLAMTPMQAGLLLHSLMAPESGTYFEQCWCVLDGPLDEAAFRAAWQRVMARHEMLRAACRWRDSDEPLLVIPAHAEPEWQEADWRALDGDSQARRFQRFLEADRRRGFALDRAPLMRFALMRLSETRRRFVWSFHHLLMDGWCTALILDEVLRTYRGQSLPPPPPSYRRYLDWRARQDRGAAEAYWRAALADPPPPSFPWSAEVSAEPASVEIRTSLDPAVAGRLRAMARRERLTLATVLQGAWALLLSRYGGTRDVIFGAVLSGRPAELADAERMVGLFLQTVPVRLRLRPAEKAADWLRALQAEHPQRVRHGHAALSQIQRGTTLFETLLIVENLPLSLLEAVRDPGEGLSITETGSYERTHYPLSLRVFPGEAVTFALTLDPSRIAPAAARRVLDHYATLLSRLAQDAHQPLGAIDMLAPPEHRALIAAGRGPERGATEPIPARIFAHRAERPDRTAILFQGREGAEELSYRALAARVDALAGGLQARGIGRGAVVGVCLERGPDLVAALLAVLRSGAVYLPVDPDYPAERIRSMIADSGAVLVLTDRQSCPVSCDAPLLRVEDAAATDAAFSPVALRGDDLAYLLYTSGSTGRPKGVAITHAALANFIAAMLERPGIDAEDRLLALTTIGFDIAGLELYAPLVAGGTVILADAAINRDGRRLAELVVAVRPTVMQATPAGWRMLIEAGWAGDPQLRLLCGGEGLDSRLAAALMARGRALWNLYGPTETTIWSAALDVEPSMLSGALVPIGGAIDRTVLQVLDPEGRPVPEGAEGELHIGGAGLSPGYWRRPGLTAESFVPNPFRQGPEDGLHLYRTGDRVRRRTDGLFDFLGRIDNQIKLRGYRIEPGEIEARLAAHPLVAQAVVLVEEQGAGPQLVAYLRWRQAMDAEPALVLRDHLAAALPAHMIPAAYVALAAFPLTPNGKVDRRALPAFRPAQSPPPAPQALDEPAASLAEIWRQLLKVDHVAPSDNFFSLGGHSLLLMSLQTMVRARLDLSVDITAFFRFPTLESMADHLAGIATGRAEAKTEDRGRSKRAGRDRLADRRQLRSHPVAADR